VTVTGQKGTLILKRSQVIVHWTDGTETFPLLKIRPAHRRGKNDNDIAVPDVFQSVSRLHLEIRREKIGYRLIDLGSRNGTLVNGIYAKDTYLKNGDEIRIGQDDKGQQIRIEFQLGSESLLDELASEELIVTIPPSSGLASESPINKPYFKVRWHNGGTNFFPIEKERVIIGRGPEANLRVPETLRFVSSQQFEIQKKEAGYFIRDLKSANGTFVNNQLLEPDQYYPIGNRSIIRIGDDNFGISISFTFFDPSAASNAIPDSFKPRRRLNHKVEDNSDRSS
jgi:pSer/pThr/pTyr-binding forkhead associated (FHA) protein